MSSLLTEVSLLDTISPMNNTRVAVLRNHPSSQDPVERLLDSICSRRATRDLASLGPPTYAPANLKMTLSEALMLDRGVSEESIVR